MYLSVYYKRRTAVLFWQLLLFYLSIYKFLSLRFHATCIGYTTALFIIHNMYYKTNHFVRAKFVCFLFGTSHLVAADQSIKLLKNVCLRVAVNFSNGANNCLYMLL